MTRSSNYSHHLNQTLGLLKETRAHLLGAIAHCNSAAGYSKGLEGGRLGYMAFALDELLRAVQAHADAIEEIRAILTGSPAGGMD